MAILFKVAKITKAVRTMKIQSLKLIAMRFPHISNFEIGCQHPPIN